MMAMPVPKRGANESRESYRQRLEMHRASLPRWATSTIAWVWLLLMLAVILYMVGIGMLHVLGELGLLG